MRQWILIFLGLSFLTACGDRPKPDTTLPREAYECAPDPAVPAGEYGQKRVRRYIYELKGVADDCRGKLAAMSPYQDVLK